MSVSRLEQPDGHGIEQRRARVSDEHGSPALKASAGGHAEQEQSEIGFMHRTSSLADRPAKVVAVTRTSGMPVGWDAQATRVS